MIQAPPDNSEHSFQSIHPLLGEDVLIWNDFFTPDESVRLFELLRAETVWLQEEIMRCGRRIPVPRLTAWYGDPGATYTYSKIVNHPNAWTPTLTEIRSRLEKATGAPFNSVLLNLYRSGNDGVGWHQDNESELGSNPVIASLSLGATRTFQLRHRKNKAIPRIDTPLRDASLVLMRGSSQSDWLHQVPRSAKPVGERINLTFRFIHLRDENR
jgi:alkylated DNA repair dioxygenase AlkB